MIDASIRFLCQGAGCLENEIRLQSLSQAEGHSATLHTYPSGNEGGGVHGAWKRLLLAINRWHKTTSCSSTAAAVSTLNSDPNCSLALMAMT